jgi:hypothetical protein
MARVFECDVCKLQEPEVKQSGSLDLVYMTHTGIGNATQHIDFCEKCNNRIKKTLVLFNEFVPKGSNTWKE